MQPNAEQAVFAHHDQQVIAEYRRRQYQRQGQQRVEQFTSRKARPRQQEADGNPQHAID